MCGMTTPISCRASNSFVAESVRWCERHGRSVAECALLSRVEVAEKGKAEIDAALAWCAGRGVTVTFHRVHSASRVTVRVFGGWPQSERGTFVEAVTATQALDRAARPADLADPYAELRARLEAAEKRAEETERILSDIAAALATETTNGLSANVAALIRERADTIARIEALAAQAKDLQSSELTED